MIMQMRLKYPCLRNRHVVKCSSVSQEDGLDSIPSFWTVQFGFMQFCFGRSRFHPCTGAGEAVRWNTDTCIKKLMAATSLLMRNRRVVESPPFWPWLCSGNI
jgi:hypothetical protein